MATMQACIKAEENRRRTYREMTQRSTEKISLAHKVMEAAKGEIDHLLAKYEARELTQEEVQPLIDAMNKVVDTQQWTIEREEKKIRENEIAQTMLRVLTD